MQYCNTKYLALGLLLVAILLVSAPIAQVRAALAQSTKLPATICIDCTGLVPLPSHLFRTSWSSEASLLYSVRGALSVQSAAKLQYILEVFLFIHIYVLLPTYTQSLGKEEEGSPSHACMISNIGIALIHSTTTQRMTNIVYCEVLLCMITKQYIWSPLHKA